MYLLQKVEHFFCVNNKATWLLILPSELLDLTSGEKQLCIHQDLLTFDSCCIILNLGRVGGGGGGGGEHNRDLSVKCWCFI